MVFFLLPEDTLMCRQASYILHTRGRNLWPFPRLEESTRLGQNGQDRTYSRALKSVN